MTDEQLVQRVSDTPVAPHEVRELLTRLTESSVESVRVDEARTLGGLALETGLPIETLTAALGELRGRTRTRSLPPLVAGIILAATVGASWWALQTTAPKPAPPLVQQLPATPEVVADYAGLVPASAATFATNRPISDMADTTFEPSVALPKGLSIAASTANVVWGFGDAHNWVYRNQLDAKDEQSLRKALDELIDFAIKDAERRSLPGSPLPFNHGPNARQMRSIQVVINSYYGVTNGMLEVPVSGADPKATATAKRKAVDESVKTLRWQLDATTGNRRDWGP